MPIRTFLALDLDEAIADRLLKVQDGFAGLDACINWVARENLHLTLSFLGDVPDNLLPEVCKIAAAVAAEIEPFEFEIRRIAVVPPVSQPRMIWADVIESTGRLGALYENIRANMLTLGLRQDDRKFLPHITLARIKFARDVAGIYQTAAGVKDASFGTQSAEELVAYASQLTPQGPIYTKVATARLGK